MIDYIVHHVKANGEAKPKVFKLATRTLQPGESMTITKRRSFYPVGIHPYYPGRHVIEIRSNGKRPGGSSFALTPPLRQELLTERQLVPT